MANRASSIVVNGLFFIFQKRAENLLIQPWLCPIPFSPRAQSFRRCPKVEFKNRPLMQD